MSFSSEEEVFCPCGESFEAIVWNSLNLKQDPHMKSLLMGGELNVHLCSMCRNLVYAERFVLVHDPATELLAFVHPKKREGERLLLEASMHRDTAQAQAVEGGVKIRYPGVLFFGMDELVEQMKKEEEESDQGALLSSVAKDAGLEVSSLAPHKAREAGLPAKLPLSGTGTPRERLGRGLKALLAVNNLLTVYADLLKRLNAGVLSEESLSALS